MDNTIIIYRREHISVAYTDNIFTSGSNFYIWYGIEQKTSNFDYIIDANEIKQWMKSELDRFDHHCLNVSNHNSLISIMTEIGKEIFNNSIIHKHIKVSEVIIENCYGDKVKISNNNIVIERKFLYNVESNNVVFVSDTFNHLLYSKKDRPFFVEYEPIINEQDIGKQIVKMFKQEKLQFNAPIISLSEANEFTSVNSAWYRNYDNSAIEANIFSYIGHFSHDLSMVMPNKKCARLHGHSYVCKIGIPLTRVVKDKNSYYSKIMEEICLSFHKAFQNCNILTSENLIRFLFKSLNSKYNLIYIELKETDNIKVILKNNG